MPATFDAATTPDSFDTSDTYSLTSGAWTIAGANRLLAMFNASGDGAPEVSSLMDRGAMSGTYSTSKAVGANGYLNFYYYIAPTAASDDEYSEWGDPQSEVLQGAADYNGVDQVTPIGTPVTAGGTFSGTAGGAITITVATPNSNEKVLACFFAVDQNGHQPKLAPTSGNNRYDINGASIPYEALLIMDVDASTTSTVVSATWSELGGNMAADWGAIAFIVKAAGGGGGPTLVTVTDTPFMNDSRSIAIDRTKQDALFIKDFGIKEIDVNAIDNLFIDSPFSVETAKTVLDSLQITDYYYALIEKLIRDTLFIYDTVLAEPQSGGGTLTVITITDGIAMFDGSPTAVDKTLQDPVLMPDLQAAAAEKTLMDYLFLSDLSIKENIKTLIDNLYIIDSQASITDKLIIDLMFIVDTITQQQSGGGVITTTTITDNLALIDQYVSERQSVIQDSLFFSDGEFSEIWKMLVDNLLVPDQQAVGTDKTASDNVLMAETRQSSRELTLMDMVLLDTLNLKVIELVRQESILLGDSVTALRFGFLSVLLNYARLGHNTYLGVTTRHAHFPGITTDHRSYLGISLHYDHWRIDP